MKVKVYVTLKPSVLDSQGKAIHHSVEGLGHHDIADIRQGKYFEITFAETASHADAVDAADQIAKNVLANPVIEDYRIEVE